MWNRPAWWWRALIVLSAGAGLVTGTSSLVYFTIDSNVLALGYYLGALYWMTRRATTAAPAPRLRGAVVLYTTITGLVAHFVLQHGASPLPGLLHGPDRLGHWSDFLLHYLTPTLVLLDWLLLAPRGAARWRDVPLWLCFPIGYTALVLVRGALFPAFPHRYPYPFLDPTTRGYGAVVREILTLTVEFVLLALAVVAADRLGSRLRPDPDAGRDSRGDTTAPDCRTPAS
ncbi:Pr6Pr family membrane protein [Nocardia wallacei]|uniref:Integral membrane regulator n=1 Tax=Nocardia wallacei TaxID=480035 RepID=A0A7G1KQL9_9NOCA|nr:Pr6Pr family membrane protein [Nocardia wallacei]BCK55534.1 integral membrane regulator [Nocardia wallacei]